MTKRLATMLLATMFLVGAGSRPARAQDPGVMSLKGIDAVDVLIENLSDGSKALGLTKQAIQNDVELKLRLAGIRVVTQQESLKLPGSPFLHIMVTTSPDRRAVSIGVELGQDAWLARSGELVTVMSWQTGGVVSNPGVAQAIRDLIKDYVDEFLNAWLSVNPKK
jgi:hypothetical protein